MPQYTALADRLSNSLKLTHPPLSIAFSNTRPEGIEAFAEPMPEQTADGRTGRVPASCVFWGKARDRSFTTVAADHGNCSVGSVTHGLKTLAEVGDNADVGALVESGWVAADIFPQIPVVKEKHEYITYAPLADAEHDIDIVFLRLNAKQVMVLSDAVPELQFEGKPQCHIIGIAKESQTPAVSVGCMLSRVRTALPSGEMTCAIPAAQLADIVGKLEATAAINATVADYAAQDAVRFR